MLERVLWELKSKNRPYEPNCPFEHCELYCLRLNHSAPEISLFTRFSKTGVQQKNQTRRFNPYCPFTKFSSIFKMKYSPTHIVFKYSVWPILSSQGFFINFHQKHVFYFCFKHLWKNLNHRQYRLTHGVVSEKLDQLFWKTHIYGSLVIFFGNISSKFQDVIQFDPCCPFKDLIHNLFKDLIKIST